jgi:hypothetical protein
MPWQEDAMWRCLQAVLVGLVLAACSTPPIGHRDLLNFLRDGATRRDDVYLHLGEPSARYEDSGILAYRIGRDDGGYFSAGGSRADWSIAPWSLVLAFDSGGVLVRHSLVEVRPR